MRTCHVSAPVSAFPLRHVPRCHEKPWLPVAQGKDSTALKKTWWDAEFTFKLKSHDNNKPHFHPQFYSTSHFFLHLPLKGRWPLPLLWLRCFSVLRVADKRNCANEPLKSLNGCGPRTKGQRMWCRTKAGPCPTTPPCSDGSERTHERGLDVGLRRRHLAPHWAKQKGQASGIHWNPSQGPQNNQELLTSLAIHWPWLIWETHACFSIQLPPSLFIILKAEPPPTPIQSQPYRLEVGSH